MVYKLRNKNLFMGADGYRNNYYPQILMMPKEIASETTFALKSKFNHHSFLRGNQEFTKPTASTET